MTVYPEPVVGALILNDKDEILLIKGKKFKDKYVVPGGRVELNEKIEEAVKREVKEETDLDVDICELVCVMDSINSEEFVRVSHAIFLDYLCKAKSKDVKLDEREAQEYVWIKPEDAINLNINSSTKAFIEEYLKKKQR